MQCTVFIALLYIAVSINVITCIVIEQNSLNMEIEMEMKEMIRQWLKLIATRLLWNLELKIENTVTNAWLPR